MQKLIVTLLITTMVLAGCARVRDSAFNPGNWFGKSRSEPTVNTGGTGADNPLIPEQRGVFSRKRTDSFTNARQTQTSGGLFSKRRNRPYQGTPVAQVIDLQIERTAAGAIIRTTGLSLRQGAYDVRLISDTKGEPVEGVLSYRLMAVQPDDTVQGAQSSRTFQVAEFVSTQTLEEVRSIRIIAAQNIRTTTR